MRARTVVRRAVALLTVLVVWATSTVAAAAPWNPFEGTAQRPSPSLTDTVRDVLRGLLSSVEEAAGRMVSRFRLPVLSYLGLQPRAAYEPPRVAFPTATPATRYLRADLLVPTPAPSDAPSNQGAFWASDCSCHQGQTCPENAELLCGAPGCPQKLTIGDQDTTAVDCRLHGHALKPDGGNPRADFHF